MQQIIEQMIADGYELSVGRHKGNLDGFWADFIHEKSEKCEECGRLVDNNWKDCGHALILSDAIAMARNLALGYLLHVPPSEFFEKDFKLKLG